MSENSYGTLSSHHSDLASPIEAGKDFLEKHGSRLKE